MRRATAVRRLRAIAERCQQVCSLWDEGSGLVAVFAFGGVLDAQEAEDGWVEVVQIALVVHEPAESVPWCSRPAGCAGLPYVLDLEKAPVDWYFRSDAWPLDNHRIRRPLRIWSRESGVAEEALAALVAGDAERFRLPAPRPSALERQLGEELAMARRHLAEIRDRYWDRTWRREHHTAGMYPENYLWDAVHGYLDLVEAAAGPGDRQPADVRPADARPAEVGPVEVGPVEVQPARPAADREPADGEPVDGEPVDVQPVEAAAAPRARRPKAAARTARPRTRG